jgi:hypothetical protein
LLGHDALQPHHAGLPEYDRAVRVRDVAEEYECISVVITSKPRDAECLYRQAYCRSAFAVLTFQNFGFCPELVPLTRMGQQLLVIAIGAAVGLGVLALLNWWL